MNVLDEQRTRDLAAAAATVLGRMSYLTAERVEIAEDVALPERPRVVTLTFAGSGTTPPGRVHVAAGVALAELIATGALGRPPTAAEVDDALREAAGVLTGHTLRLLSRDEQETFARGMPRVEPVTEQAWREAAGRGGAAVLDVEGEPMILWTSRREKGFAGRGLAA